MDIVLVRHAQPHWEPDGIADDDPRLTEMGRRQAVRVGEALAGEHFDVLYSSPVRRVRETVAPIAARVGLEPRFRPWLKELGLPSLAGRSREEVQDFFHAARSRALAHHHEGFPGGEHFGEFRDRVVGGLEELLVAEHALEYSEDDGHVLWHVPDENRRVLVIAHEGTNSVLISHLLGLEVLPWSWMKFSSAWAGITRLHLTAIAGHAVWSMESFNDVAHLSGLEEAGFGRATRLGS